MPSTTEVFCGRCATPIALGERYKVRVGGRDDTRSQRWCRSCINSSTRKCNECNTRYSSDDDTASENLIHVESDRNGRSVYCYLDNCYADYVRFCGYCESPNYIHMDYCNSCNRDSDGNARRCRCGSGSESQPIHNYSCEPTLVFHGVSEEMLFMGFELETQVSNTNIEAAARFARNRLQIPEIAQLKQDGSIGGGFEIVTQPHTYEEYHDNIVLWDTIETLRKEYGARSWDSGTCGLHIHISRKAFSGGRHTHRFIEFIYRNSDMMMKFGGRKTNYARFNDVWGFDEFDKPIFTLEGKSIGDELRGGEKYTAVNTSKRDTLELRFMRGTMNTNGVKAGLGLAHAMVQYTRELNETMSDWYNWQDFVDYVNGIPYTYPELIQRLPQVPELVLSELENSKIEA